MRGVFFSFPLFFFDWNYFNGLYVNVSVRNIALLLSIYLRVIFVKLGINRLLVSCQYTSGNFTRKCMKFTLGESKDVLDRKDKVNDTTPKCCHSNVLKCTLPIPPLVCFLMPCGTLLESACKLFHWNFLQYEVSLWGSEGGWTLFLEVKCSVTK